MWNTCYATLSFWTKSWNNNNTEHPISTDCLHTKVMKCDKVIKELFIQARKEFDLIYPDIKEKMKHV